MAGGTRHMNIQWGGTGTFRIQGVVARAPGAPFPTPMVPIAHVGFCKEGLFLPSILSSKQIIIKHINGLNETEHSSHAAAQARNISQS